jgi:Glycosyltransferase family 87
VGSRWLVDPRGFGVAFRRVGWIAIFAVLPLVLVEQTAFGNSLLYDFHGGLYEGGHAILHCTNPYRSGLLNRLAALARAGRSPSLGFAVPVYPAPALAAFSLLSILPFAAAGTVFTLISVAAFVAGLRLLGVRDWRCYGAAFLSSPLLETVWLGQVNGLLVFGLAVVWRWRDRLIAPAVAATCLVMVNLFLWPIGLVLLLGRRYRVVALAAGLGATALVAWPCSGSRVCWPTRGCSATWSTSRAARGSRY